MKKILICGFDKSLFAPYKKFLFCDTLQIRFIDEKKLFSESSNIISSYNPDVVLVKYADFNAAYIESLIDKINSLSYDIRIVLALTDQCKTELSSKSNVISVQGADNIQVIYTALSVLIQEIRLEQCNAFDFLMELKRSYMRGLYFHVANDCCEKFNFGRYFFKFPFEIIQFGIVSVDSCSGVFDSLLEKTHSFSKGLFSGTFYEFVTDVIDEKLLFIINYDGGYSTDISSVFERLLCGLKGIFSKSSAHITICLGLPVFNVSELNKSFESAEKSYLSRIMLGTDRIINASELDLHPSQRPRLPGLSFRTNLSTLFEHGDTDQAFNMIKSLLNDNYEIFLAFPYTFPTWFEAFSCMIIRDLSDSRVCRHQASDSMCIFKSQMNSFFSYHSSTCHLFDFIRDILQFSDNSTDNNDLVKMSIAKEYIESHFNENIRLEDVAKQIYLAPAYFGIYFKRETGMNFREYLFQIRMNKAVELLKDIRYNISEIASCVGYKDTHYFSKQFKKYMGVTPREYRRQK